MTPTELSRAVDISVPYASQILGKSRKPSRPLAIRIYRATGWRHASIEGLTDADMATLERIEAAA